MTAIHFTGHRDDRLFRECTTEETMSQAEPSGPENPSPSLPADARRRIDDHLDAIERVLVAGGLSRGERRGVVDEVESQIYDMLAVRTQEDPSGLSPAEAVAAIVARLDPPSAYAPEASTASAIPAEQAVHVERAGPLGGLRRRWQRWWSPRSDVPRLSPPALVAAVWLAFAALLFIAALGSHGPARPLVSLFFLIGMTAPLGVTALGYWSVRRIRRSAGREYGLPLALVETFLFPIVLANVALIGLLAATDGAGLVTLAVLVIFGANIGLARYAWRRFGQQFLTRVDSY
jgi:hypothetical protein